MKQIIIFLVSFSGLISCTIETDDKETKHMAIAKKYMDAVENKNIVVMDSLLSDNYKGYGPSVGDSVNKKEALDLFKRNVETLYESFQYTRHKNLAVTVPSGETKGDRVLNWAYLTIKYKDGRGP